MYKKTAKSSHYIPRTGSYSTVPHRNGRVDVLPPSARQSLHGIADQIADGKERIRVLRAEKLQLENELTDLERKDALRLRWHTNEKFRERNPEIEMKRRRIDEIRSEIRKLNVHVSDLNALVSSDRVLSIEGAFFAVARARLDHSVWIELKAMAEDIVARAGRKS
jgi:hypothetical protein